MFVTNPCTHDARVMKEAETLASEGYSVRIYALVSGIDESGIFDQNGYSVERVLGGAILARYQSKLRSVFGRRSSGAQNAIKTINNHSGLNATVNHQRIQSNQGQGNTKLARLKSSWLGGFVIRLLGPARKFLIYYHFCSDASTLAHSWGADVAHCHDLSTLYAGKILKRKSAELKVVYDSHELWIHRNRVGREAWIEKRLDSIAEKHLIGFSDRVITVCDSIGDWLSGAYPDISKPVIVRNMPYSVNAEINSAVTIKDRLGIAGDKFVLIYTGKITPGRGIELGVKALAKVANSHLVLLGYGDGTYVDSIKQAVQDLGVSTQVTFCDAVAHDEVVDFVRGADLALVCIEPVCLSYEYALPNKLFESIQAGVPVLGSGLVEIEKIVKAYDIGICFDNENDMISKLDSLRDEQLKQWRYNISSCKNILSWNQEKFKLVTLYDDLFL